MRVFRPCTRVFPRIMAQHARSPVVRLPLFRCAITTKLIIFFTCCSLFFTSKVSATTVQIRDAKLLYSGFLELIFVDATTTTEDEQLGWSYNNECRGAAPLERFDSSSDGKSAVYWLDDVDSVEKFVLCVNGQPSDVRVFRNNV